MALFNFLKKGVKQKEYNYNNILLAMPMFNNNDSYRLEKIIENLKVFWGLDITNVEGNDEAASFVISGETIALANMPVQIPRGDIESTAKYAYNWPSALKDLEVHTGHALVTIMTAQQSQVDRCILLGKVLSAILMTSDAVAIYQGSQSLLIPKQQYLGYVNELKENSIPVALWIYIGLRKSATGNCAYTYGLKDFQKTEMEIIDSKLGLEELFDFLFNITSYVMTNDIVLKNGETAGLSADQKIPIKLTKGQFVEGKSLKLLI